MMALHYISIIKVCVNVSNHGTTGFVCKAVKREEEMWETDYLYVSARDVTV